MRDDTAFRHPKPLGGFLSISKRAVNRFKRIRITVEIFGSRRKSQYVRCCYFSKIYAHHLTLRVPVMSIDMKLILRMRTFPIAKTVAVCYNYADMIYNSEA